MKENNKNTVQNQFTAYLVASIKNRRARYMESRYRLKEKEYICEDIIYHGNHGFEDQFFEYISGQVTEHYDEGDKLMELLKLTGSGRLMKSVSKLKDKEQNLLFGRVFGELSFAELARMLEMRPKQAEMAYYYIVRKIRKEIAE